MAKCLWMLMLVGLMLIVAGSALGESRLMGITNSGALLGSPTGGINPNETRYNDWDTDCDDQVAFRAAVEAVHEDGSHTIAGRRVDTDHRTAFDPHHTAIIAGAHVDGKAYRQADGSYWAEHIKLDDDYEVEFEGFVEAVDDDGSYTIAGSRVYTFRYTKFDPHRAAIVAGAYVEVQASRLARSGYVAVKIERKEHHDDMLVLRGATDAVHEDGSYTIAGYRVYTDHRTAFEPNRTAMILGAFVDVEAYREADGSYKAEEIGLNQRYRTKFKGYVEAVHDDGSYTVKGSRVYPFHYTEFDPQRRAIVTGAYVQVKAYRLVGGSYLAEEIGRKDDNDHRVELKGAIDAVHEGDSYTIAGHRVYTNHRTAFDPHRTAMIVGAYVEVEAHPQADGRYWAEEIGLDHDYGVDFEGYVEAVHEDGSYRVAGSRVHTFHYTEFGPHRGAIVKGAYVQVKGYRLVGGYVAEEIEREDEHFEWLLVGAGDRHRPPGGSRL